MVASPPGLCPESPWETSQKHFVALTRHGRSSQLVENIEILVSVQDITLIGQEVLVQFVYEELGHRDLHGKI